LTPPEQILPVAAMPRCPVCRSPNANLSATRRALTGAPAVFRIECPDCPVPFEMPGTVWNLLASDPMALERRRSHWDGMLRVALELGEPVTRLY